MFEIGNSLREARLRRKLELSQVEHDTHIRAKYLMALEDERFDALPGTAYAKGFLRTYADYLGLDGPQFVDEFNARLEPEEELPAAAPVKVHGRTSARTPLLLTVPVAVLVAIVAWQLSTSGGHSRAAFPPRPATRAQTPPRPAVRPTVAHRPLARIVVAASRGSCWLAVRRGSATGQQIFQRTLQPGERVRFVAKRLWIRFGAPWNADATLNGKSVRLPSTITDLVVTSTGIRAVG